MHYSSKCIPGAGFESTPGGSSKRNRTDHKEPTAFAGKQQKIDYKQLGQAFSTPSDADTKLAAAAETEAQAATSMAQSRRIEVLVASLDNFPPAHPIRAAMETGLHSLLGLSASDIPAN